MSRNNDSCLFRAEWEYLNPPDNEEPETDKSPEYEALEWLKEVYYAYPVSYTHLDVYKRQLQRRRAPEEVPPLRRGREQRCGGKDPARNEGHPPAEI